MIVAAATRDFSWEGRDLSRVGFGLWWAWPVACGASVGGVEVHRGEGWRHVGRGCGARMARGSGWHCMGIGGVAGGSVPWDRGVPCGEGLGGVGTGVWHGGAQMVRGGGWWRVGDCSCYNNTGGVIVSS
jgi:hypothetical protein